MSTAIACAPGVPRALAYALDAGDVAEDRTWCSASRRAPGSAGANREANIPAKEESAPSSTVADERVMSPYGARPVAHVRMLPMASLTCALLMEVGSTRPS